MHDKADIVYSRTSERVSPRRPNKTPTQEKPKQSAKAYAVWLLSKREYSAATLQKKLLKRGYAAEETAAALQFLRAHNYQSDTRYAGMKARSTAHRAGDWKIAMALAQQGIDEDLAKEQIAELAPEDERAVQSAAAKFAGQVADEGMTPQLAQKIWRYLGYRGFSGQAIKHALNVLKEAAPT
jgi:regulatory protein